MSDNRDTGIVEYVDDGVDSRFTEILDNVIEGLPITPYVPQSRMEALLLELKNLIDEYLDKIPTKTSDLINDSGFITNAVNDIINYYLKSETYTKQEINSIIASIETVSFKLVNTLPTTDIQTNVIYLVPKNPSQSSNIKDEYINLDGTTSGWEKIGDTEIDLSDYVTETMLNAALANYVSNSDLTTILSNYALSSDIPTALSQLTDDATHRLVTDTEKTAWNSGVDTSKCYKITDDEEEINDTSHMAISNLYRNKFETVTDWSGYIVITASRIWTDGINTYFSSGSAQMKLNGTTWEPMIWSGMTNFNGNNIWTDGTNIYYSSGTSHKKLNGTTWESVTWSGLTNFNGDHVWTDGTNIYYSTLFEQYKLNGVVWESMVWSGRIDIDSLFIWTDGVDIYFSINTVHYKLNGTTWEPMTWSGMTNFSGDNIWTDGVNTYYSYGTDQYKLNGTTWEPMTWIGVTNFNGQDIWTDGTNIYYSSSTLHYKLVEYYNQKNALFSSIKTKLKSFFDGIYSTFSGSYNDLTDKPETSKVIQMETGEDKAMPILLDPDTFELLNIAVYSRLVTVNPILGELTAIKLNGATIGSNPQFTDTNDAVTQTATTGNTNYEVLFSQTADNTTRTEGARKNSNLKFNPSTGNLQATQLNGVNIGSSPKFTDTDTWRPVQNNLTSTSTSDCLSANQGRLLNNGKSNLLTVSAVALTVSEVTAGGTKDFTASAVKSGYTQLGVVGTRIDGGGAISLVYCYINSSNAITMRVRNNGTSAKTPGNTYAYVLYIKDSLT